MMMNCPSDETLAAFIDGRLEAEARSEVIAHLSSCAACRAVLQTAHEYEPAAVARRSWLIPAATLAAAAAIAAVLFLGPIGDRYRVDRYTRALTAATAGLDERAVAARPSIDIAYKPHSVTRGRGITAADDPDLLTAAAKLDDIAREDPSAANLHAAGVALLLTDRYDADAVTQLEAALQKSPLPSAELLNDLAAAYYETRDDAKAKATIERAWRMKQSAAIAWTRAFILGTRDGWNDYLKIDPHSEWSAEARRELDQIGN